jgi:multicomponent Na+:H+ antiporter subunit D
MLSTFIFVPFLSILIFNLPFFRYLRKAVLAYAAALFCLQIAFSLCLFSPVFLKNFSRSADFFNFNLSLDGLSAIMLLSIGLVLFVTLIVSSYLVPENKRFNFINLLLFMLCGLNGLCLVHDIFSLYVFLEISAVASYILIAFNKDMKALSATFKYVILSIVASILMISSIALLVLFTGSTNFFIISSVLKSQTNNILIISSLALFICASFIKGGVVPFHGWVVEAYAYSGASVSILLAGIVSKALGIYTLIRVVKDVFGLSQHLNNVLLVLGTVSIIVGALAALSQKDFKKMLAFSSISQVGYIVLGLGSATALGVAGAVFHLFNHAVFKSLLFVNSAAVEQQTKTTNMRELGGLSKNMPITGWTSVLASLSAAGIPPLAGFWSKLLIVMGLFAAGRYGYAALAILLSILTLAYLLSMQRMVFFGKVKESLLNIKEADFGLVFSASLLAVIIIGVGVFYPFILGKVILHLGY